MAGHVRDSLTQVEKDSWLIDNRFLLRRRQSLEAADYLWKDGNGWHFSISDAPTPLPAASPLPSDSFPKLVHDTGGSAVFDLGDALLRVKRPHPFRGVTPEPVTLRWLAERKLSFPIPKTLYYTEDADRVYHIVTRVPGRSVDEAWRDLTNEQKQYCVTRVAEICQELSAWTSDTISGVDRSRLFDPWLDIRAKTPDLSSENLLRNCQQLQMDTSAFVFNHNDLGPTNVMVDVNNNCNIGIVDWEMGGFVPFSWVRTKLATSWAMDFCWKDVHPEDRSMSEWRERVAEELGKYNVPHVIQEYKAWYEKRKGES